MALRRSLDGPQATLNRPGPPAAAVPRCPPARPAKAPGGSHRQAPAAAQNALQDCAAKFHEVVTYQPASRYWAFRWYELAIFPAAAVMAGACIWLARRHLS